MFRLGSTKAIVNWLPCPVQSRQCFYRRLSTATAIESHNNLFNYTSGRWIYNEALRHKERKITFDVDGLLKLAAKSVNQHHADVVGFSKLSELPLNRSFLITFRDGERMVARIPYPMYCPKFYGVASEVATNEYLRSHGIPVLRIYGYSPHSDNGAGVPYIFTELVDGIGLDSDVWYNMKNREAVSVFRQLVQLEAKMMSLSFPAGGSLYFTKDLEEFNKGLGIPLEDKRFCVGPDTNLALWHGSKRAQLDVNRGPYKTTEELLAGAPQKEMAYLKQFGKPLLPLKRYHREAYNYLQQSPLNHIKNLECYLKVMPSLIPSNQALNRFCIRHRDLHQSNVMVAKSDSGYKIVSITDWQNTSILPMFLHADIPSLFHEVYDDIEGYMDSVADYDPEETEERDSDRRGLLAYYHYLNGTKEYNPLLHATFTDPLNDIRRNLFLCARAPWEAEPHNLKMALIEAVTRWKELTGEDVPCPVMFDPEDIQETIKTDTIASQGSHVFYCLNAMARLGEDGWVSHQDYEHAMNTLNQHRKWYLEEAKSEAEREEFIHHWPWDDMDEDVYM